jgi:excisionase family DNA binding protein
MDDFISIREVARRVGMSYMTILTYVKEGRLNAIKVGGRWRVSVKDYEKFTEGHYDIAVEVELEDKDV